MARLIGSLGSDHSTDRAAGRRTLCRRQTWCGSLSMPMWVLLALHHCRHCPARGAGLAPRCADAATCGQAHVTYILRLYASSCHVHVTAQADPSAISNCTMQPLAVSARVIHCQLHLLGNKLDNQVRFSPCPRTLPVGLPGSCGCHLRGRDNMLAVSRCRTDQHRSTV